MSNKPLYGKVKSVENDYFVIRFEVPGVIDNGKALPLNTMMQPEIGDEIILWGGDDLLNNLYCYSLVNSDYSRMVGDNQSIVLKAFNNYIQNIKGGGLQIISSGDFYNKAEGTSVTEGNGLGLHGGSGKVDVSNEQKNLLDIFNDIINMFAAFPSIAVAGGYPVLITDPSKITQIKSDSLALLGNVNGSEMSDGSGSTSSSSNGQGAPDPSPYVPPVYPSVKDLVTDLNNIAIQLNSLVLALVTAMNAGIISTLPGSPCVTAAITAAMTPLITNITTLTTQLSVKIALLP